MKNLPSNILELGHDAAIILFAVIIAKLLQFIILKLLPRLGKLFGLQLNQSMERYSRYPLLVILIFATLSVALDYTSISDEWLVRTKFILKILSTLSIGWLLIGVAHGVRDWLEKRYAIEADRDPLGPRRFKTQIRILMRVVVAIIVLLTLIATALVIPGMRQLGMSLFASAGVAGIVIGMAANTTLSNLIAGIQLALTQPILLGDEVVVNNQSGTIEEINATYVVIRLGDLRRYIVPLNYFMQNPFENWTYHDASQAGGVLFYADYKIDIEEMRAELKRIVEASPKWDKKTCTLTVSNCKEQSLELKAQVSSRTSGELGDLQAEVREKMVLYLQKKEFAFPYMRLSMNEDKL